MEAQHLAHIKTNQPIGWSKNIKYPHLTLLKYVKQLYRFVELLYVIIGLFCLTKKQGHFQPLYNFNLFKGKTQRLFLVQADALSHQMKAWGHGGRILEVGCNLGFFSLYFADRGYVVTGIDHQRRNIAICRLLEHINRKKTHFYYKNAYDTFLTEVNKEQYDLAFLFDLIHHLILKNGLERTQHLMAALLEKIPVLFVELARKNELLQDDRFKALPEDELAVFAQCSGISIERICLLQNHSTGAWRPLYLVKKKTLQLCGQQRPILGRRFTSHHGAGYFDRVYYDCGDHYVKKYLLRQGKNDLQQIQQEIDHFLSLPKNDHLPMLLSHQKQIDSIEMLFNKLPGENVHNLLAKGQTLPLLPIIVDLIKGVDFLFKHQIFHNDLRLWNIMYDGKKAYLFDLGRANKQEKENSNIALLWIISQLHQFDHHKFKHPLTIRPDLNAAHFEPELGGIITCLKKTDSLETFLDYFSELRMT